MCGGGGGLLLFFLFVFFLSQKFSKTALRNSVFGEYGFGSSIFKILVGILLRALITTTADDTHFLLLFRGK